MFSLADSAQRARFAVLAVALSGAVFGASAQDTSLSIIRSIGLDRLETDGSAFRILSQEPKPDYLLTTGVAYARGDSARALQVPFRIERKFQASGTSLVMETGYSRFRATETIGGIQDVTLLASRLTPLESIGGAFLSTVGLSVPSKNRIGSDNYSQQLRLGLVKVSGSWAGVVVGAISHRNGTPSGSPSTSSVLHIHVVGELSATTNIILAFDRAFDHGHGATSFLTAQLARKLSKTMAISFVLATGLTDSARRDSARLEVNHAF